MRLVSTFLVLFAFWLLLSGFFTAFLMLAGIGSALAVVLFARRMDVVDHEGHPIHLAPRALLLYWPWLIKEIVKSACTVASVIVRPSLPISPTLVRVRATQKTDVGRATFANSITLTPGTLSVEVGEDEILVHALTRSGANDLAAGEMDRRVTAFERKL
ncbi:MAG TPA: Na+/H+ antiporter subunit E [Burkholderiales bacterium]|nr:Na+/H+ antiporter subunit E [Burkholderiales bacterium]